jgi:hypothetical protein
MKIREICNEVLLGGSPRGNALDVILEQAELLEQAVPSCTSPEQSAPSARAACQPLQSNGWAPEHVLLSKNDWAFPPNPPEESVPHAEAQQQKPHT